MSLPVNPCAACPAVTGHSCCETGDPHGLATLTSGDEERIRAATGKSAAFFVDTEAFSPEEAHAHAQLRPANRHAAPGGVRRHLRLRDGACVFHGAARGCTLSPQVRPLLCRLYPAEIDDQGRTRLVAAGRCHAEERAEHSRAALASLGLTPSRIRRLHAQLMSELALDARTPR